MNENVYPFYKHSGKFGIHGPVLAVLAACAIGYPLGILYAHLIKWISVVYINIFITLGYGLAFGFMTALILRFSKVRNGAVACLASIVAGLCASYLSWNGFVHVMVVDPPTVITPADLSNVMDFFYDNGSWGIGASSPVTGILLVLVWLAEAGMIIGTTVLLGYGSQRDMPFDEKSECWLDEEKKIDKLEAITVPDQIAALQAGNIAPLDSARPRVPASGAFTRLILRHSPKCAEFCTLSVENVTTTYDKKNKPSEKKTVVITNLQLPKMMFDQIARLDHISAQPA